MLFVKWTAVLWATVMMQQKSMWLLAVTLTKLVGSKKRIQNI
ncbi:hypothetical protein [Ureibacillus sinduriensis]|nr:hypothetical protein [Ureibacillus sinduriensis]